MFDRDPLQMATDELLAHGGNQRDVEQLKAQFSKAHENTNREQVAQIEIAGDIPS